MDLKAIENKWQKKWKEEKAFEPSRDNSKEKFFGTVPYPYANSAMHIGHGRAYTTPDIYIRYQRLKGKNVLFPLAYHISGTPVLAVADGITRGDQKQINITRDAISDYITDKNEQDKIIESFKDPYKIAEFFIGTIEKSLDAVGISIDWTREFSTGDKTYQKFIEWQFKKLYDAGILIQGKYPILYSAEDGNAVGEDDIKDGDSDKVSVQEMNYIMFELKESKTNNEKEYMVVATLRPDALFGTTNLWVDPSIELVKLRVNGKLWIVAKDAVVKIKHQFDNVSEESNIDPKELIGKYVITPITNKEVIVAEANFLDSKHGTGIVYSSPAGAPHDYMALIEAKKEGRIPKDVEIIVSVNSYDKNKQKIEYTGCCPAEDKIKKFGAKSSDDTEELEKAKQELYKEEHYGGKLNELCGEFEGLPIKFAKDKIQTKLMELGLGGILYEASRRAVTRNGSDVIVANLEGQWFLDYSRPEIKEKAYALLDTMTYNPTKMKATQKGYLDWVQLRPCARKRGIGTPLPFDKDWVIESLSDSTIYQMFYLVAKIINRENLQADQLKPELFDYVFLGEGNPTLIAEDMNVSEDIVQEIKKEVDYWKSFDFRYTAGAHLSNHLSFLIYHYALIFPKRLHPKNVTIGGMLIKDGHKISKSKGNGIPLVRVKQKYGADLYRLYIAVGANYDIEMDFRDEEIEQLEKKFSRWIDLIDKSLNLEKPNYENLSKTDKWLISSFYTKVEDYFEMFDNLRMREAYVGVLYEFLNDINYHERRTSTKETLHAIRFIAKDYIKIMTPAIPHICEEFYSRIHPGEFVSTAVFNTDFKKYQNKDIEEIELIAQELTGNISRAKMIRKITEIKKISILQASDAKFLLFDELKELLSKTKDFKTILLTLKEKFPEDIKFIQKFVPKTLGSGLNKYLDKKEEKIFLESLIPFLKKEYSCEIEIIENDERAKNAIPGKPMVFLE